MINLVCLLKKKCSPSKYRIIIQLIEMKFNFVFYMYLRILPPDLEFPGPPLDKYIHVRSEADMDVYQTSRLVFFPV